MEDIAEDDYERPSRLAERIRDTVRGKHENCRHCPLSHIWAADIQEILDLRDELARQP